MHMQGRGCVLQGEAWQLAEACPTWLPHTASLAHLSLHRLALCVSAAAGLYRIRPSVTHEPFHPLNFPGAMMPADVAAGAAAAAGVWGCRCRGGAHSLLAAPAAAPAPVPLSARPSMPCPTLTITKSSLTAAETLTADFTHGVVTPNQLRWRPFPLPADNEVRQGAAMSPSWAGLCRACREAYQQRPALGSCPVAHRIPACLIHARAVKQSACLGCACPQNKTRNASQVDWVRGLFTVCGSGRWGSL